MNMTMTMTMNRMNMKMNTTATRWSVASFVVLLALCPGPGGPLAGEPIGDGWVTLFDGTNARHWDIKGSGDTWMVEDGTLTNRERARDLRTVSGDYDNFELEYQYKVVPHGNSGLYLRGRVEIQILDSHGKAEVGRHDDGAVYSKIAPKVNASKPAGEWNTVQVRFIGRRLAVVMNDTTIHDNVIVPDVTGGAWGRDLEAPGPIRLQGDHGKVWFRGIRIRPLFKDGWKCLFNGKDTTGWKRRHGAEEVKWIVEDGCLTNAGAARHDIVTTDVFRDFIVHYEYKIAPGQNGGTYLRGKFELQILDSFGRKPEKHQDGALYDTYAPRVIASKPAGEWNVVEAKIVGMKITAVQNGKLIHEDAEMTRRTDGASEDEETLKGPGPILLQGDHGRVWYANIWIKPLGRD